jgi:hypothetical protein
VRVYVETTVWSFAFADDSPDYTRDTLRFFDRCRAGQIAPVISGVVIRELERSPEPTLGRLMGLVSDISPEVLELSDETEALAQAFLEMGVAPPSKPDDARHVAAAFVARLDVLVSWNFKHIASIARADRFNAAATLRGYHKPLRIVTPIEVLYGE